MPPSPHRPPSGQHDPDDTRIRVAVIETKLEAFERLLEQTRVEMRDGLDQLGADLGGLATKEELRDVSAKLEQLTRSVDRLIGSIGRDPRLLPTEPMRSGRDKSEATTKSKDDGDITVKALFWNAVVTGLKLIGAGIVVAIIAISINSKFFRADGSLPSFDGPATSAPAHAAPAHSGDAGPAPSSTRAGSAP